MDANAGAEIPTILTLYPSFVYSLWTVMLAIIVQAKKKCAPRNPKRKNFVSLLCIYTTGYDASYHSPCETES